MTPISVEEATRICEQTDVNDLVERIKGMLEAFREDARFSPEEFEQIGTLMTAFLGAVVVGLHKDAEVARLKALINTPRIDNFLEAVRIEAAHQAERWGTEHDEGKSPTDWFWLLGFLGGKAVWSATHGDREKALHHTISSAAVLMNWHAQLSGEPTGMRPGIATPTGESP